jgi:hypothetical protein
MTFSSESSTSDEATTAAKQDQTVALSSESDDAVDDGATTTATIKQDRAMPFPSEKSGDVAHDESDLVFSHDSSPTIILSKKFTLVQSAYVQTLADISYTLLNDARWRVGRWPQTPSVPMGTT